MYLTTKNAGITNLNTISALTHYQGLCCKLLACVVFVRVWSPRAENLWGSREGASVQKEGPGSDRCTGSGPSQFKEQAAGVRSSSLRHHHPLWVWPCLLSSAEHTRPDIAEMKGVRIPQLRPENRRWTRGIAKCTPSWRATKWSATLKTGVLWSMASMMETCMALKSAPSMRW